ncbi:hypothetical protein ABZ137_28950 [Streptomyces bobili]|uniref:alpha-L-rhamnosidase-related protein n=1 Tax=Streptomyces bobili TaxID=67280 RepID=UPI0033B6C203
MDWSGTRWIGGREARDHDWQDLAATVVFRGGSDAAGGLSRLLRAEPIGKTWGEGLDWTVRRSGDDMQPVMRTSHSAGNTWVDGTSKPNWGVDHYDPQSEINPTTAGTGSVPVGSVTLPASTGLTADTWATRDHTVKVETHGLTVTTTVNGVRVDSRTLTGDQIRMDEVGRGLGRTERAAHYVKLARTLRKAFITHYWNASKGHFTQGSLSSENALALAFDLVPGSDLSPDDPRHLAGTKPVEENKKALAKLLADRIVAADQHIQNDMYGSRYEFNILGEYGCTDIALKAVTRTGQPGVRTPPRKAGAPPAPDGRITP